MEIYPKTDVLSHGKHACPGRFFAVNEIKVLLVYTLVNYDIKFAADAPEPKMMWFSGKTMPDMSAKVLLKKLEVVQVPWNDVSQVL